MSAGEINPKLRGDKNQHNFPIDISKPSGGNSIYLPANANQDMVRLADLSGSDNQNSSICIGYGSNLLYTTGTRHGGIAIGQNVTVGRSSVAIGGGSNTTNNGAQSQNSVAIGIGSKIGTAYQYSVAIGYNSGTNGSGSNAVQVGYNSWTSGSAVAIGSQSSATNNGAIAIGYQASSSGSNSTAIGSIKNDKNNSISISGAGFSNTVGYFHGQISFYTGYWSSAAALADRPIGVHFTSMWTQTTDATTTELGVGTDSSNTPTNRIDLSNDSSYIFDCDIIARDTTLDTSSSAWNLKFAIRRGAAAANTSLIGSATKTVIGQDATATTWDVDVTADTTNGRPNISVTGAVATTIRWVANVRITKVSG